MKITNLSRLTAKYSEATKCSEVTGVHSNENKNKLKVRSNSKPCEYVRHIADKFVMTLNDLQNPFD